jgi:hypothetical protein
MNVLTQEIEMMQNPALGAVLLWRFTKAYTEAHPQKAGPPLPLAFLVLPLLWHVGTAEPLASTRTASGLRLFAGKFNEPSGGARDVLLAVQDRAIRWREKTAASLRVAYATGLVELGENGHLQAPATIREPDQNRTVATMVDGAEKLGVWFAALSLDEISLILYVRF